MQPKPPGEPDAATADETPEPCVRDAAGLMWSEHALLRQNERGVRGAAVEAALEYGDVSYSHQHEVYAITHRAAEMAKGRGVDITKYIGVHVVTGEEGEIMTVYRNRGKMLVKTRKPRFRGRK